MSARRYVVLGAGAVGGALGATLHAAGCDVVLIARGAQLAALQKGGLSLALPSRTLHVRLPAVSSPREVHFEERDVVLLTTKSQDTAAALVDLAAAAPRSVPIVCAQNGVANERLVATAFGRAYGLLVYAPCQFIAPGLVSIHAEPVLGGLDLGCDPTGTDDLVTAVVHDLALAGFDARAEPRVRRMKYGKLLTNIGNALQALSGDAAFATPLQAVLQDEAIACYRAAGIDFATVEEIDARFGAIRDLPVGGEMRGGGSSWQSLARGTGSIETDFLNGEIVRLGEHYGVGTPCNRKLTFLARKAAAERWAPGRLTVAELEAALAV